jgi:hypothetical protein
MRTKCAAVVIASSFLAVVLLAQTPTATLVGRIVDATGCVVPGATIQVREAETNKTRTAESQVDGGYTISNLPPGLYEVTLDKPGFRRLSRTPQRMHGSATRRAGIRRKEFQWFRHSTRQPGPPESHRQHLPS